MFVNEGKLTVLRYLWRASPPALEIGLYTNTITITDATQLSDLTEATFPGYARILTSIVAVADPTINGDDQGELDSPTLTWAASGDPSSPEVIKGMFVRMPNEGAIQKLLWAENFVDDITITLTGDQVQKKINFYDDNLDVP